MLPYVMHSIQELSGVCDLSNWENLNIQCVGKLLDSEEGYIVGGVEKNSPSTVQVDFSLSSQIPPKNTVIRLWGVLESTNKGPSNIKVKVKIVRTINEIDIPLYRKSLLVRREFYTLKKKNRQ